MFSDVRDLCPSNDATIMAQNDFPPKVQTGHHCCKCSRCYMKTHFHVVRHQDLAGLLDHWLRLEFLFAEGVPHGVEVLLARGAGQTV